MARKEALGSKNNALAERGSLLVDLRFDFHGAFVRRLAMG
jgi:hypothetical protein